MRWSSGFWSNLNTGLVWRGGKLLWPVLGWTCLAGLVFGCVSQGSDLIRSENTQGHDLQEVVLAVRRILKEPEYAAYISSFPIERTDTEGDIVPVDVEEGAFKVGSASMKVDTKGVSVSFSNPSVQYGSVEIVTFVFVRTAEGYHVDRVIHDLVSL